MVCWEWDCSIAVPLNSINTELKCLFTGWLSYLSGGVCALSKWSHWQPNILILYFKKGCEREWLYLMSKEGWERNCVYVYYNEYIVWIYYIICKLPVVILLFLFFCCWCCFFFVFFLFFFVVVVFIFSPSSHTCQVNSSIQFPLHTVETHHCPCTKHWHCVVQWLIKVICHFHSLHCKI